MLMFLIFCLFLGFCIVFMSFFFFLKYFICISKDFGYGGMVCVCFEKDCVLFSEGSFLLIREYVVYMSIKVGDCFCLRIVRLNDILNLKLM